MKVLFRIFGIIALLALTSWLQGCSRAHSNMQTLVTSDCGVTWTLIKPGEVVPSNITSCDYRVTIPDYPMQGDLKFKSNFKGKVLATIDVAYDYSIVNGLDFIQEAKFLGSKSAQDDNSDRLGRLYETAENAVIDKRIREKATELLLNEDVVEFSQGEFEAKLELAVNEMLKARGVILNSLSFVPVYEEQTRLAIDTATAMKIYEARNMRDLGEKIAAARAGATKVTMQVSPEDKEDK